MREMKDSGVEWIGEIPENWNVALLSSFFTHLKCKNTGMVNSNLLSLSYGNIIKKNIDTFDGLLPENFEGYNLIKPGCIVLRLTDLQNDHTSLRVGYCNETGIITSAYVTIELRNKLDNSKYFYYVIHSFDVKKGFYGMGSGVRQGLTFDGVKKLILPIPSRECQTQIVDYLDEKCSQVDALISNVQAQMEKLKAYKQSLITEAVTKGLDPAVPMKDSGVEWMGEIPQNWEVSRIKYLCEFNPSKKKEVLQTDIVSYAPMDCIRAGNFEHKEIVISDISSGLTYFEEDDILMAKVTPCFENGNIVIADNLTNGMGFGSSELFVFRATKSVRKWLFYFLQNDIFKKYAAATMTGTGGLKRVSPIFVNNYSLAVPPLADMEKMAAHLDEKCAQIDRLIAIKQQKIEKLNQYKKSLIYEYVTGKKEVGAWISPKNDLNGILNPS